MKHFFFFAILVLVPVAVLGGGLLYLIWHTFYTFFDDWMLNRELEEIRAASRAKRAQAAGSAPPPSDTASDEFVAGEHSPSTTVASGEPQDPGDDA